MVGAQPAGGVTIRLRTPAASIDSAGVCSKMRAPAASAAAASPSA